MDIDIYGFGNIETTSECVILRAEKDDNIGNYIILATTVDNDNKVSTRIKYSYWFPDKKVCAEDIIFLMTKTGVSEEVKRQNYTAHFFYWGLDNCIWNKEDACAVIVPIREWKSKKVVSSIIQ